MVMQILVPIHTFPDGNADGFAVHVATVAKHLDAEIHAQILTPDFPRVPSPLGNLLTDVSSMVNDAKAQCEACAQRLLGALEQEAQYRGIPLRTTTTTCIPAAFGEAVASLGRYHDLIVVGLGTESDATTTAEAAIFNSGRPTLLIPELEEVRPPQHVMIAWDGSRAATRAITDAHAFLRRADAITIAAVVDEKHLSDNDRGTLLADYFKRHGIDAGISSVHGGGRLIAETLQAHAQQISADMIVMGGFGHSRFRDFILGGATRGILQDLRLPALLSH